MKTMALNIAKWMFRLMLGLIIVVGLCWWLIPDEALNPEVDKFTSFAHAPPAANNAYFMIWGFAASPELDPHVVGRQIVAAHDRIVAADKDLSKFKVEAFNGERPLMFPKDSKRICDLTKNENCLMVYQTKLSEVRTQSEEYKIYLARYRKIREYEDFGLALSQLSTQSPMAAWNPILRISDLVDGNIAERMKSKATQRAALEAPTRGRRWRRRRGLPLPPARSRREDRTPRHRCGELAAFSRARRGSRRIRVGPLRSRGAAKSVCDRRPRRPLRAPVRPRALSRRRRAATALRLAA